MHHQLYSLARSIDLSYTSGPSYKVGMGFRALLTSLCYHLNMLLAFSFIVIHCPCSGLLFFPTSIAVDTNPGCLWLLKPPPTHGWPLQFISGGRKVKRHLYFQTCPMQSLCKHILKHMNHFLLMSDISPVHPSSVTVTGYITIAFSRIRLPPCKCIQICL